MDTIELRSQALDIARMTFEASASGYGIEDVLAAAEHVFQWLVQDATVEPEIEFRQ